MKILHEINAEGKTIVVVTHDMEVAKAAKKQFYIEDGDGRIKEWKARWQVYECKKWKAELLQIY